MLDTIKSLLILHKSYVKETILVCVILGIVVSIGASCFSVLYIPRSNTPNELCKTDESYLDRQRARQKKDRDEQKEKLQKQMERYEKRLIALKSTFTDPELSGFHTAKWESIKELEREIVALKERKAKLEAYDMPKREVGPGEIVGRYLLVLVSTFLFLLPTHFMLLHGSRVMRKLKKLGNISRAYFACLVILWSVNFLREIYTSIILVPKTWYGWDSFFISSALWTANKVLVAGITMVGAYPFALGFCLSSKDHRPEVNIQSTGASCGVGGYVLFLQTWTIIASIITFFPPVIAIKILLKLSEAGYTDIYLVDLFVPSLFGMIIVVRMIARAISIRISYWSAIDGLGMKWKDITEMGIPPDPTKDFLGEHWWNLPASLTAVFLALWFLVKLLGLETFLITSILP